VLLFLITLFKKKAVSLLNFFYQANDVPVAYHCITKTIKSINPKTNKEQ
jgi:hypothetical protein